MHLGQPKKVLTQGSELTWRYGQAKEKPPWTVNYLVSSLLSEGFSFLRPCLRWRMTVLLASLFLASCSPDLCGAAWLGSLVESSLRWATILGTLLKTIPESELGVQKKEAALFLGNQSNPSDSRLHNCNPNEYWEFYSGINSGSKKLGDLLKVSVCSVVKLGLTLCDPVDCSLPGSIVHGILQASILRWVTIFLSRGSSWPRDRTPCLLHWQVDSLPLSHQGRSKLESQQALGRKVKPRSLSPGY